MRDTTPVPQFDSLLDSISKPWKGLYETVHNKDIFELKCAVQCNKEYISEKIHLTTFTYFNNGDTIQLINPIYIFSSFK